MVRQGRELNRKLKDENGNVKKKIVIASKTKQSPSFYEIVKFAMTNVKIERTKLSTQF